MARKRRINPTTIENDALRTASIGNQAADPNGVVGIAETAFRNIVNFLPGYAVLGEFQKLIKALDSNGADEQEVALCFSALERRLQGQLVYEEPGDEISTNIKSQIEILRELGTEFLVKRIESEVKDLPINDALEIVTRKHGSIASDNQAFAPYLLAAYTTVLSMTENEIEIRLKSLAIQKNLGLESGPGSTAKESPKAKLLADICPMFAAALPETRQIAWKLLEKFTRKQWAYFADKSKLLTRVSKTERARQLEAIAGVTSLRRLFGTNATATNSQAVNKVITLLNADAIKEKNT